MPLKLPDTMQVAPALHSGCESVVTVDCRLSFVSSWIAYSRSINGHSHERLWAGVPIEERLHQASLWDNLNRLHVVMARRRPEK
ncbi:MAG: hypothetical protein VX836_11815 [Pseudomonadota bacterium]|jgi:hypothetical protein|nr:hypothetical protein [Pseudomonadota bacterium]